MITLLLVDEPAVRRGLRMWLLLEPDITVVGEASTGEEALTLAQRLSPDVVLMAVGMPGLDGIAATAALRARAPWSAAVVLSPDEDALTRTRAQTAGAAAVVAKHRTAESLLAAIRQAAQRAPRRARRGASCALTGTDDGHQGRAATRPASDAAGHEGDRQWIHRESLM